MILKKSKALITILTFFLMLGFAVTSQAQNMEPQEVDSVTNEELKKVAATIQEARKIQRQANQKLRKIIKETEITFQRYRLIMMSRQKPEMADSLNITQKEQEIIKEIQPKLAEINRKSKKKLNKALKSHGLTQKRLQEIMLVIRTKPEVAKRFQQIVTEQRNDS